MYIDPGYATFAKRNSWGEVQSQRDLAPTTPCLLEVERLNDEQQIERLAAVASKELLSEVFLSSSAVHVRRSPQKRPSAFLGRVQARCPTNAWALRL